MEVTALFSLSQKSKTSLTYKVHASETADGWLRSGHLSTLKKMPLRQNAKCHGSVLRQRVIFTVSNRPARA